MNLLNKVYKFNSLLNASPYSLLKTKFNKLDYDISDLFIFRLDQFETIFIAENNLALLLGKHIKCNHIFNFFDLKGQPCGLVKVEDRKYSFKLSIDKETTNGEEFGSFTHHTEYPKKILEKYSKLLLDISFHHRGYSGYRRSEVFGYSYVHGNFGGLYLDNHNRLRSLARLRRNHIYTPQLIIKSDFSYDFLFANPTNKNVNIKFFLIKDESSKLINEATLLPWATHRTSLGDSIIEKNCNISWETSFPIGRCIIFEYNSNFFDVFHS
jgi:hypothetical protein